VPKNVYAKVGQHQAQVTGVGIHNVAQKQLCANGDNFCVHNTLPFWLPYLRGAVKNPWIFD
jgi:hypothetical protein